MQIKNKLYLLLSIVILLLTSCAKEKNKNNYTGLAGNYSFNKNGKTDIEIRNTIDENNKDIYFITFINNSVIPEHSYNFVPPPSDKYFKTVFGENYKNYVTGEIVTEYNNNNLYIFQINKGTVLNNVIPNSKKKLLQLSKKVSTSKTKEENFSGWDLSNNSGYVLYVNANINGEKTDRIKEIYKILD